MRTGLRIAIESAGWKVVEQADTIVIAKIGRGEKETLHFRTIGTSLFAPGQKVKIQPYNASVEVRQKGALLWSQRTMNMVPSFLTLEQGQSLTQAVKAFEKPDPGYFERLTIPPKILKPEARKNVGSSSIKNGRWADR